MSTGIPLHDKVYIVLGAFVLVVAALAAPADGGAA